MTSSFGATNVVVAVRARPLTHQEEEKGESNLTLCMDQQSNTTTVLDYSAGTKKKFTFDYNYWSIGEHGDDEFASQERIYAELGEQQLRHALSGYNACIFAYGQTSSGKTYTMMGPPSCTDHSTFNSHTGLIPRLSHGLFEQIRAASGSQMLSFRVEMSFYEIYNEKVYCLLEPNTEGLRPREDPKTGPYVENLLSIEVHHYLQIAELLKLGNKTRHTGKTRMNERSSRSHAVLCLTITKSEWSRETGDSTDFVSKVNLVDLAGSERTHKAGTDGDRLKEGININKSLSALGMVIKKLADLNDPGVASDGTHVPYRDSTLTWLLKDNLGGNSRTVMLATLSPCRYNFDETYTTLRYAERVKMIRNAPTINKRMSNRKLIRELKAQVRALMDELSGAPKAVRDMSFLTRGGGILAHSPLLARFEAKQNEPILWFLPEGFAVVCGYDPAHHQTTEPEPWQDPTTSPAELDMRPSAHGGSQRKASICDDVDDHAADKPQVLLPVSRRSSVGYIATGTGQKPQPKLLKKMPSYLQPTLAAAYKDTGMSAQLRDMDAEELGKDYLHTVASSQSGSHTAPQGQSFRRKASLPGSGIGAARSDADDAREKTVSPTLGHSQPPAEHARAKRTASLRRKSSTPSLPRRSSSSHAAGKRRGSIAKALNVADRKIASASPPETGGEPVDLQVEGAVMLAGSDEESDDVPVANNSLGGNNSAAGLRFRPSITEGASSVASGGASVPVRLGERRPSATGANAAVGQSAEDLRALFAELAEGGVGSPRPRDFPPLASLDGSVWQLGLPGLARAEVPHVAVHRNPATEEVRVVATGAVPVLVDGEALAPYTVVTLPPRCDVAIGGLAPLLYINPLLVDDDTLRQALGSNVSFNTWQRRSRSAEKLHNEHGRPSGGDASGDASATDAQASESASSPKQVAGLAEAQQTIFVQEEQIAALEAQSDTLRGDNRVLERAAAAAKNGERAALEELAAARRELAELQEQRGGSGTPWGGTDRTGTPAGDAADAATDRTGSPASARGELEVRGGRVQAWGANDAETAAKLAEREEQQLRLADLAREKEEMQQELVTITEKLAQGETERHELVESLKRMDIERKEERKEMAQRSVSYEEAQAQQRLIQSEVSDKYRQLDILKAQIGDKKHAARQLQDSYNERLSDLEREAWEKHRAIKELLADEQEIAGRVLQLKQEEERIAAKINKYRKAKEDQMDSTELNSVDVYEFIGGLRLDDIMFRTKGIQLSRQSRTPIWLRFTPSALMVYNADSYRTSMQPPPRARAASPAGRNGGLGGVGGAHAKAMGGLGYAGSEPSAAKPLKELAYDRIVSFKQVDKEVIQISSHGFSSDVSFLCDNKQKRNSIIKLLMLKTKGVILSLHNGSDDADRSSVDASPQGGHGLPQGGHGLPQGVPVPPAAVGALRRDPDAFGVVGLPHSHAV